ncbi:monocarboxylate transporter 13-like [Saccoglossus kowalevskii]
MIAKKTTRTQDGGCDGWLVVLGSHICCMFIYGVYQAFGPLFVAIQCCFHATSSCTSWILSLSLFLELGLGLGYSLILSPCLGIIPLYIKKKYTLANSLAVLGSGIGPFLLTPIIQLLIDAYGWRGTFIVMSAINAHMFISGALFKAPTTIRQNNTDLVSRPSDDHDLAKRHHVAWCAPLDAILHALDLKLISRHPLFALQIVCVFSGIGLGSFAVPSFIVLNANDLHLASPFIITFLISILATGGIIGRVAPPVLLHITCKWMNSGRLFGICLLLAGISTVISPHLTMSYVTYAVHTALYGFFIGVVFALYSHVTKDYVGGPNLTAALALASTFNGLGAMIGPTVAGLLYDITEDCITSFYFCGGCTTFAGILMLTVEPIIQRIHRTKDRDTDILINNEFDEVVVYPYHGRPDTCDSTTQTGS